MTAATLTPTIPLGEQARGLQSLLRRRRTVAAPAAYRSLAVTSGKGGVGKSVLAVNLAVALAQQGANVCLLDGHAGLGSFDVLCGRNAYWNLSHVVAGARQLEDVVQTGPAGIRLLPGAASLLALDDCPDHVQTALWQELSEFVAGFDVLILDAGSGLTAETRRLVQACDEAWIVTTPDPLAVAEAYAAVKLLRCRALHLAVNRASRVQAERVLEGIQHTAHAFLQKTLTLGAAIPDDEAVARSLALRTPMVLDSPDCPAARAVRQFARQWQGSALPRQGDGFVERLFADLKTIGA